MKPLRAFAAGMLVGALTTFGVCLAWQPGEETGVRSGLAALAVSARDAAGRLAAAMDLSPSPRSWTMRRPVETRLRMLRTGVVLTHSILPERGGTVPAFVHDNAVPGRRASSVIAARDDAVTAPTAPAVPPPDPPEPKVPSGASATADPGSPGPAGASSVSSVNASEPSVAASASQALRPPIAPATSTSSMATPVQATPVQAKPVQATSAPVLVPDQAYARALKAYEDGRHQEARRLFTAFLRDFPGHGLAPNAVYWTGETWYAQARYDKAAEAFARVLQDYPRHAKSPDALLKLAYVAMRQGRPDEARQYLDQLQARYPGSGASRLGRQARGRLEGRNRSGTMVATHG